MANCPKTPVFYRDIMRGNRRFIEKDTLRLGQCLWCVVDGFHPCVDVCHAVHQHAPPHPMDRARTANLSDYSTATRNDRAEYKFFQK